MADKIDIAELVNDAKNGNGCAIGEKLNLLALTDRVNVLQEVSKQASAEGTSMAYSASNPRGLTHLALSQGGWLGTSLYHEDYRIRTNSSTIDCTDLNLQRPGATSVKKSYTKQY